MLKDFREYRKNLKEYKENYILNHTYNKKKKYREVHINKVVNLYNELCFYINELEQFFVEDYFRFNRYGINYDDGEYECLINGLYSDYDWIDGYHIGNVYNCYVESKENFNKKSDSKLLWETYSDCYCKEYCNWILKFYCLSMKDQKKLLELIDNNNILHYYGENGCLMHSIVPIREALNGTLDKYIKTEDRVKVRVK